MFTKIVFNSRLNITKISNIENAVATHVVIVFRTVTDKNFTADSKSVNKMHAFRLRKKIVTACYHCSIIRYFQIVFLLNMLQYHTCIRSELLK